MQLLIKLKDLISSSSLTQEERTEWTDVLSLAPDESLMPMIELFEENQDWIAWTYHNYKKKGEVLNSNDTKAAHEILKEEADIFKL